MKRFKFYYVVFFCFLFIFQSSFLNAQKGKVAALEVIGGSGGLLCYNSYLIIGLVADGIPKEVYSVDAAVQILDEQIGGLGTIADQYQALLESGFLTDKSDSVFAVEMKICFGMIIKEAEALKTYVKDKSDANADLFSVEREKAWKKISEILDLEESTEGK